jgi:hypothetical protein
VNLSEWSGAHLLHFDGMDWGGVDWRLECVHVDGDQTWCTFDADGEIETSDCWLMSWWSELGAELFEYNRAGAPWPKDPSFPFPVRPWDWDPDNGGTIGPDLEALAPVTAGTAIGPLTNRHLVILPWRLSHDEFDQLARVLGEQWADDCPVIVNGPG